MHDTPQGVNILLLPSAAPCAEQRAHALDQHSFRGQSTIWWVDQYKVILADVVSRSE